LLQSQGVPMLTAGDEFARTQQGNNNAYCHDNELTWIDWGLTRQNADLLRFFRNLIQFRNRHPVLRRRSFAEGQSNEFPPAVLHGTKLAHRDFSQAPQSLAVHFKGGRRDKDLYVMANGDQEVRAFELPIPGTGRGWYRFMDTILEPPAEIVEEGKEPRVDPSDVYTTGPRSVVVLISK
jgi:isoamylase